MKKVGGERERGLKNYNLRSQYTMGLVHILFLHMPEASGQDWCTCAPPPASLLQRIRYQLGWM